ncbi:UNVERIFIED_CONTAM: hypothetical protein Scaly_1912800 [Sesamum calycinum]|uniref:Transposase-associated domain-containing protein n=1 Tax=Sesamum calycinum TaxID=2727403 RepID=A0AAW2NG56_9LAMI
MYNKNLSRRAGLTLEFKDGLKTFIEWAMGKRRHMDGDKIRCSCRKCKNTKFGTPDEGNFEAPSIPQVPEEPTPAGHVEGNYPQWGDEQHMDWVQKMVFYVVRPSYFSSYHERVPNDGTRSCQVDVGPNSYCYDGGPYDYDELRRTTLIWSTANFVGTLEVVFTRATAEHMTWHATHQIEKGSMCHPFNAEAWKHFDRMYPDFAKGPRNVRLGLCTDGFAPHCQYSHTYSCWSIIITPYNLPPSMCMSFEYIFLKMTRRVVDDSKWTGIVAHQPEEVVPVPIVVVDIQSYDLRDPNGLQVVLEVAENDYWCSAFPWTRTSGPSGGLGRGRRPLSPSWAEPADPTSVTPSSEVVSQSLPIPADSGTVGLDTAGASSSQVSARPWDTPPLPAPPERLLPTQAQRHYISLQDASPTTTFTLPSIMRSKGIICILGQHFVDPTGALTILVSKVEGCLLVGLRRREHVQDRQVAGPEVLAEAVCRCPQPVGQSVEAFLRLLREYQGEENSSEESTPSSQASVTPNEHQLWMSATGGRKRAEYSVSTPMPTT